MTNIVGAVLIVIGAILLVMGINAADSVASDLSRFFTGSPTDRSIWLILGGAAALVAGLASVGLPRLMPRKG